MPGNSRLPWDFADEYISPDGHAKLRYGLVGEIAMGAPLAGSCFLIMEGTKYKLPGIYGGPVVWSSDSEIASLPYWTEHRFQKMAIVDLTTKKVRISEKIFSVLSLSALHHDVVYGVDSTKQIAFDINKEVFSNEMDLVTDFLH